MGGSAHVLLRPSELGERRTDLPLHRGGEPGAMLAEIVGIRAVDDRVEGAFACHILQSLPEFALAEVAAIRGIGEIPRVVELMRVDLEERHVEPRGHRSGTGVLHPGIGRAPADDREEILRAEGLPTGDGQERRIHSPGEAEQCPARSPKRRNEFTYFPHAVEGNGGRAQVKGLDLRMPPPLRDHDAGERNQRRYLRTYIAVCFGIIVGAAGFLFAGASALVLLFVVAGVGLGLIAAEAIWFVTDRGASGLVHLLHSTGSIPYTPTWSAEDALVARGDYQGAAEAFRRHVEADPLGVAPALRLAELYRNHLHDPAEAERWYLEARRRARNPGVAANQLIDLYRASGNRGRLMAELARFAASHAESDAGRAARKELQLLKESPLRLDAGPADP